MKSKNPFDEKLEIWKNHVPSKVADAAIFVTDTLELCWASAQSVFVDKATPDLALAIYDRVVKQMAAGESEQEGDDNAT